MTAAAMFLAAANDNRSDPAPLLALRDHLAERGEPLPMRLRCDLRRRRLEADPPLETRVQVAGYGMGLLTVFDNARTVRDLKGRPRGWYVRLGLYRFPVLHKSRRKARVWAGERFNVQGWQNHAAIPAFDRRPQWRVRLARRPGENVAMYATETVYATDADIALFEGYWRFWPFISSVPSLEVYPFSPGHTHD